MDAITLIERWGIPTHSYVAAATSPKLHALRSSADATDAAIAQLAPNTSPSPHDPKLRSLYLGYLVQEFVRAHIMRLDCTIPVAEIALQRAQDFYTREPWHWVECSEEADDDSTKSSQQTTPAVDPAVKKSQALSLAKQMAATKSRDEIIDIVADTLNLSPNTVTTYIRGYKKKPTNTGASKTDRAVAIVKENFSSGKEHIVTLLMQALDTTNAGAQTYYYSAIKRLKVDAQHQADVIRQPKSTKAIISALFDEQPTIERDEFVRLASERFNVNETTAKTYFYAIVAERGIKRESKRKQKRNVEKQ